MSQAVQYMKPDAAFLKNRIFKNVSGYMPVGRHYGFIYNEFNNTRTISHELGHGVNVLHHTFSDDSESFHTTAKTDNLMDYNGGIALNHKQWQWSHEKHRNVLGFLDDEGESENVEGAIDYLKLVKKTCAAINYTVGDETMFSNDLVNNYLVVRDDFYRYRNYIINIKCQLDFLTKDNVSFTNNRLSSGYNYDNNTITIASAGIESNDVLISIFHEYLHRVNHVLGIFNFNISKLNARIDHIISVDSLSVDDFDRSIKENTSSAIALYSYFWDCVMTDTSLDINIFIPYELASELPQDLYQKFKEYCQNKGLAKSIPVIIAQNEYLPTNYIRDELSVYHWCLEYENLFGGMSSEKRRMYESKIRTYMSDLKRYEKIEKTIGLNEEGYEK